MPNCEAAELMEKVRRAYEEVQTLHAVARHELVVVVFEGDNFCGKPQSEISEIEMWFKRPKLRVEYKPLVGSSIREASLVPQVIIADGKYEYRLSEGKWRKIKRTVNVLNFLGLFQAVYASKEEGELFGHPVWVVEGQLMPDVRVTWWIDKDTLIIGKYKLEGKANPPFEVGLEAEVCNTIQFRGFEPGFKVPDEKFSVPPDIPIDERPMASFFEDLLRVVRGNRDGPACGPSHAG